MNKDEQTGPVTGPINSAETAPEIGPEIGPEIFRQTVRETGAEISDGAVSALTAYPAKGASGQSLQRARLLAGLGMEGDFHADGGPRQLSIFTRQGREWLQAREAAGQPGLCFARFKENITLDGVDLALQPGDVLSLGECRLQVSGFSKHCHAECPLFSNGQSCVLAGQSLFATVLRGGVAQVGDAVHKYKAITEGEHVRQIDAL